MPGGRRVAQAGFRAPLVCDVDRQSQRPAARARHRHAGSNAVVIDLLRAEVVVHLLDTGGQRRLAQLGVLAGRGDFDAALIEVVAVVDQPFDAHLVRAVGCD